MENNGDVLTKLNNGVDMSKLGANLFPGFPAGRRLSRAVEPSERRVLVIYTGGTIGMVKTDDGKHIWSFYLLFF